MAFTTTTSAGLATKSRPNGAIPGLPHRVSPGLPHRVILGLEPRIHGPRMLGSNPSMTPERTSTTAHHRVVATLLDTHQSLAWPDDIRTALEFHLEKTDAHDPAA